MTASTLDRSHFPASLEHLYDWLNGEVDVPTRAPVSATGAINFTANPAANSTVTLDGTAVTFVASGASGNQVNIGANLAASITALATFANASADANISKATYTATPTALTISNDVKGAVGNSFTLAATAGTVSGPNLTGGVDNATPAAFNHYETVYLTSGSGGSEKVTIGTTPKAKVGQKKLFTLGAKGNASDSVTFTDPGSFTYGTAAVTAVTLTNVGDFVYAEWTGSKFNILYYATGVVTHA